MMTEHSRLVEDYLENLNRTAQRLPKDRREDLIASVREHIAVALDEAQPAGEAEVRQVLEQLGSPEEIVSAALADETIDEIVTAPKPARRVLSVRPQEFAIVLLLLIGGFAVCLGWLVGVMLLWFSTTWNIREKLLGTLVVPGGLALSVAILTQASASCEGVAAPAGENGALTGETVTEKCQTDGIIPFATLDQQIIAAPIVAVASLAVCFYLLRRARRAA